MGVLQLEVQVALRMFPFWEVRMTACLWVVISETSGL